MKSADWTEFDRREKVEADEHWEKVLRHELPVEVSKPVSFPNSQRWWHRLRGHHTRSRFDLMECPYAWQCLECEITIGVL